MPGASRAATGRSRAAPSWRGEARGTVLGGGPESVEAPSAGLLHGLYWLVANLAEETPVAVVVDDAQWADEPSLLFLAYLARRVESLSVAVVIGARRDHDPAGAVGRGLAEIRSEVGDAWLELQPLGPEAVRRLLREFVAGPVDDVFASACRAATGGNPFLLGELLRSLVADDVPFTAASAERVRVGRARDRGPGGGGDARAGRPTAGGARARGGGAG